MTSTSTDSSSSRQFAVHFVTRDERWSIPSTAYNINGKWTCSELNSLLKSIINENTQNNDLVNGLEFIFLIDGKLIQDSLEEFIDYEKINGENEIQVEYALRETAPKAFTSLLHDDWVSSLDVDHNWIISGCYDNTLHIWSLGPEAHHMIAIPAHAAPVKAVKWIPSRHNAGESNVDEHLFVSTSHDETAIIWKWNSSNNQVEYKYVCVGHSRSVDCVDINNDLIATGSYDRMLKIWSMSDENKDMDNEPSTSKEKKFKGSDGQQKENKNKAPLMTMSAHTEAITGCVWITDSHSENETAEVATCSLDNTIRTWDIEVGQSKLILNGSKPFLSLSYSPLNHYLISGSCDRHVRLWDPRSNDGVLVKSTYSSHQAWISSVEWSKDNENQFISGSYDNVVKEWDMRATNAPLYDLLGHEDKVLCVNWTNPQFIISGGADNQMKIFSTKNKN